MQPRLKSSTKWTKLPQDVTDQIRELFKQNFQKELQNAEVVVEGRIYKQEILLRVGYLEKGRLTQHNFEISMDYKLTKADSALSTLHVCIDAAGSLMAEFFESEGEAELPLAWSEYPFEGKKVWLQYSTTNTALEKQANALLGEDEDALVQGEVDEAEDVGTDDDDNVDYEDEDDISVNEDDTEVTEEDSPTDDEDPIGDPDSIEDYEDDDETDDDDDDDDGPRGPLH